MKLRPYEKKDSKVICSWLSDEAALYKWSADRIGRFPLEGDELNREYYEKTYPTPMYPMTMVDEEENVVGHILLRFPDADDKSHIRFGFVIVDKAKRGQGLGRKLLELAKDYAVRELGAKKISLAVFSSNPPAIKCYRSEGFSETGDSFDFECPAGTWKGIVMEYIPKKKEGVKALSASDILEALGMPEKNDIRTINPLVLAHVGDAVYELVIRTVLAETMDSQVQKIHKKCTEYVNCHMQCVIMHGIEEYLTEEEHAVFKRARNTKSNTMPRNASPGDYRTATGFEALCGWLYLMGRNKRLLELLKKGLEKELHR